MKAVALASLVLLAAFAAVTSCSISHRSGEFQCTKQQDCMNGRECINGYCVLPGGEIDARMPDGHPQPDANLCPSACTTCDVPNMMCTIDCAAAGADCSHAVTCPAGWNCIIKCTVNDECRNGIDCSLAKSCNLTCSGSRTCEPVNCGAGKCTATCTGFSACRGFDCSGSCACDVTCNPNVSACFDPGVTCPLSTTFNSCDTGLGCTSQPLGCHNCI